MNAVKIYIKLIPILFILFSFSHFANGQQHTNEAPVEFIENKGQWLAPFQFKGQSPWASFYLKKDGIRFLLSDIRNREFYHGVQHGDFDTSYIPKYYAYDLLFINANKDLHFTQSKTQKNYYNYFIGNNPAHWKSKIHPSLNVDYNNLFDGIDAHFYSENGNLKYDFIVSPNANVDLIKWKYDGLDNITLSKEGNLILGTSLGEIKEMKPYCYQFIDGEKKEVFAKYTLDQDVISFNFPNGYNKSERLIIDPTIVFCSFTGSTVDNWGFTATYDSLGNYYAGGIAVGDGGTAITGSYPVTTGVIQPNYGGGVTGSGIVPSDCVFTKFNSNGTLPIIYATYFGGVGNEQPHSMIVDHAGNLVIAGRTFSTETSFPLTGAQYDGTYNGGGDLFVAKFSPDGTILLGSTYVGGSGEESVNGALSELVIGGLKHNYADDARSEVIVDLQNNVYVATCTKSSDFPLVNPLQNMPGGLQDGAVIQLNANLTSLLWSTYLGGAGNDAAYVLAINKTNPNEIFVGGGTESTTFPSTAGTWHQTYQGGSADGFLLKFNTVTKAFLAGTFIGTNSYDQVFGVQTDDSSHVFIVGQTTGAYQVTPSATMYLNPNSSQFITKLSNNLATPLYSTTFGKGTNSVTDIAINAFLVDKCENVYVSGWGGPIIPANTGSTTGLPTTANALQSTTDGSDYYFIVLSKNFQNLVYASFFGQNGGGGEHVDGGTSRFDENGVIYQAICSACGGGTQNFPVTPGAAYTTKSSATNCNFGALKIKFDFQNPKAEAVITGDTIGCAPLQIAFGNSSTSASSYFWDFGDGTTSTQVTPTKTYFVPGNYVVKLIAYNPDGCTANSDTMEVNIIVKSDSVLPSFTFIKTDSCNPYVVQITNTSTTNNGAPNANTTYSWDFGDGTSFNGANPPLHTYPSSALYTITLTMTDTNACNSPATFNKIVDFSTSNVTAAFSMPDSICLPAPVQFTDQSVSAINWSWSFGDGNSSTTQSPSNTYTAAGLFTITLISSNPATCNKIDSIKKTITVLSSPVADFSWSPNPPEPNKATNFKNLSTGAISYLWDFGDGTTSTKKDETHIYEKDGTYNVCLTATNAVGCRDSVCKPVRGIVIPLAEVPSGFSPNGDGYNDVVYVKGYGIRNMTFRIFNRWGEKVFETKDKTQGWDGRYKGMKQEMEVYQYTLSVEFMDGTKSNKKGNITLLK